jgi:hypothetical protein
MSRTAAPRKSTAIAAAGASLTIPALKKGETYAGVLLKDGKPSHHLIVLPGDERKNWKDAIAWAKKQGGEIPTRKEQALLFANASGVFEGAWYWSSEEYSGTADYAWIQYFLNGLQFSFHKSDDYRCRAVRRVPI